jgi:hypothetical protein
LGGGRIGKRFNATGERGQASYVAEVSVMEQELESGKMAARPSHEAIEKAGEDSISDFKSEQQKIDQLAMKSAKRAENRINANEERIPGSTIFSK